MAAVTESIKVVLMRLNCRRYCRPPSSSPPHYSPASGRVRDPPPTSLPPSLLPSRPPPSRSIPTIFRNLPSFFTNPSHPPTSRNPYFESHQLPLVSILRETTPETTRRLYSLSGVSKGNTYFPCIVLEKPGYFRTEIEEEMK